MSGPTEDMVDAVLGELCSRFDDVGCVEADDPETWDDIRKTCVGLVTATARSSGSGPMGPERLDSIRFLLEDDEYHVPLDKRLAVQLLAHADHWEAEARESEAMRDVAATKLLIARAEAKRYRSRCPVTAEDVEAAGVTREHAEQWLHRLGFDAYECMGHSTLWRDIETEQHACTTSARPGDLAAAIGLLANASPEQCPQDILDEMAAQDTGAEVDQ